MIGRRASDNGFGLVEVIIGMLLLAIIAVAILPALWQGIRYSTQQSATATATRQLYSLIEGIRDSPSCGQIISATGSNTFKDGGGRTLTSSGTYSTCPATDKKVTVALVAKDASGATLASVKAIVYVP